MLGVVLAGNSRAEQESEISQYLLTLDKDALVSEARALLHVLQEQSVLYHHGAAQGRSERQLNYDIENALEYISTRLGWLEIEDRLKDMLKCNRREIGLVEAGDADGLLQEGFLDESGYQEFKQLAAGHRRAWLQKEAVRKWRSEALKV